MRVKCLAQQHNAVPRLELEPGPLDLESGAITVWAPRLSLPEGGGGTPIHCLYGYVPPNGVVILNLLI